MEAILFERHIPGMKIKIEKINHFWNICKISKVREKCNIEVEYIPNKHILEIQSYRDFFDQEFNLYVEDIAILAYKTIEETIKPKFLCVRVYLEDKSLTPRSVEISNFN